MIGLVLRSLCDADGVKGANRLRSALIKHNTHATRVSKRHRSTGPKDGGSWFSYTAWYIGSACTVVRTMFVIICDN